MGWWWSSNSDSNAQSQAQSQAAQPQTKASSTAAPDAEFQAAFPHLAPSPKPSTSSSVQSLQSSPYPTEMSCRAAFDSAFFCKSPGGRFMDIYRYGAMRDCSEHWTDFWFCMRIKSKAASLKRELVEERYRQKEERLKAGPNSEDVWDVRGPRERVVGAFRGED